MKLFYIDGVKQMIQDTNLIQEQRQTLSARQVQSLHILACSNQELDEFLTNEFLENPLLECTRDKENEMMTNIENLYEKGTSFEEHYAVWADEGSDRRRDIADRQDNSRKEFLLGQLSQKDFSSRQWKILELLVDCLDEYGFFRYQPEEIGELLHVSAADVAKCLDILKALEPVGVFSADLSECLIRQAEAKGIHDETFFLLIRDYLQDLIDGHIGTISRRLHLSTIAVKEYIHLIGTLNPRPFVSSSSAGTEYVIPDILLSRQNGSWEITLNDQWMGDYRYNDYYLKMMQETTDPELTAYFRERMERARFVLQSIEQRRQTILRTVRAILEIQENYFEGSGPLVPMTLEDVAARTGLHVSTVSRAVREKHLQYHRTCLLKDLFSSAASEKDEHAASASWIRERIRELIRKEDPGKPLSDARIAELLEEEGISISRRTAAKYRSQLGILDSRQRLYYDKRG